MKAGVTSILSENVISRMPVTVSMITDTISGATSSLTVMVLPRDNSIGLPKVSTTAELDMSNRGDAIAATERLWISVNSMEMTAESASVLSVAPASETDCPESWMVSPDRSTVLAGVVSTVSINVISKIPVSSFRAADVSTGP